MNSIYFQEVLEGCKSKNRKSQKELYKLFFGFAMKICLRYAESKDEAIEVVNDGFLKIFTNIQRFDGSRPFQSWLSTIMINTRPLQNSPNFQLIFINSLAFCIFRYAKEQQSTELLQP